MQTGIVTRSRIRIPSMGGLSTTTITIPPSNEVDQEDSALLVASPAATEIVASANGAIMVVAERRDCGTFSPIAAKRWRRRRTGFFLIFPLSGLSADEELNFALLEESGLAILVVKRKPSRSTTHATFVGCYGRGTLASVAPRSTFKFPTPENFFPTAEDLLHDGKKLESTAGIGVETLSPERPRA